MCNCYFCDKSFEISELNSELHSEFGIYEESLNYCDSTLCIDCVSPTIYTCTICRITLSCLTDAPQYKDQDILCSKCSKRTSCILCQTEFLDHEFRKTPDDKSICDICFTKHYYNCSLCNKVSLLYIDHKIDNIKKMTMGSTTVCNECSDIRITWHYKSNYHRKYNNVDEIKSRINFGVELEISQGKNIFDLYEKLHCWGAKNDETPGVVKEFYSPPLRGDDGLQIVSNFCKIAKNRDWRVDGQCGYHLHIDCSTFDKNELINIAKAYHYTYLMWQAFVGKHRWGNRYCGNGPTSFELFDKLDNYNSDELNWYEMTSNLDSREQWINWMSYPKFGTVEIRLHEGTLDYETISNWIKAHLTFIEFVRSDTSEEFSNLHLRQIYTSFRSLFEDKSIPNFYRNKAKTNGINVDCVETVSLPF